MRAGNDVRERELCGVKQRGCKAAMVSACVPWMVQRGGGAIVNVSSVSGRVAQTNRWTYNATKGAITSMTRCQALDLAPSGIRVNSVAPGWIWTRADQLLARRRRQLHHRHRTCDRRWLPGDGSGGPGRRRGLRRLGLTGLRPAVHEGLRPGPSTDELGLVGAAGFEPATPAV
jgi:hypothetical protein